MPKRQKSKSLAALHESMTDLHQAGAIDHARMRAYDTACLGSDARAAVAGATYEVYKVADRSWRWQLRAGNGEVVARSGESFKSRAACLAAIDLIKKLAGAPVAA